MKTSEIVQKVHTALASKKAVHFSTENGLYSYSFYTLLFSAFRKTGNTVFLYFICDDKHFFDPSGAVTISDISGFSKKIHITTDTSEKLALFFCQHAYNTAASQCRLPKSFSFDPEKEYRSILEKVLEDYVFDTDEQEYVKNFLKAVPDFSPARARQIFSLSVASKLVELFTRTFSFIIAEKHPNEIIFRAENTKKHFMTLAFSADNLELIFSIDEHAVKKISILLEKARISAPGTYALRLNDCQDYRELLPAVHVALNQAVHGLYYKI